MAGRQRKPDMSKIPLDTYTDDQLAQFRDRFKFSEEHHKLIERIDIEIATRRVTNDFSEIGALRTCAENKVFSVANDLIVVISCILIFRAFKYTFYRVLPSNIRNIVTSAFGLATLYVFYAAEDIMLITPLVALFVSLKFLFPASSRKKGKKVSESEEKDKIVEEEGTNSSEPVKPEETETEEPVEESVESVDTPVETPVETPIETPVETPIEEPSINSTHTKIAIFCVISYTLLAEFYLPDYAWSKVRGTTLIMSLKLVSALATSDVDCLTGIGYMLHPATVIFGPWCPISAYKKDIIDTKTHSWISLFSPSTIVISAIGLVLSLVCLTLSTCVLPFLFQDMYPDPEDLDSMRSITGLKLSQLRVNWFMAPWLPMTLMIYENALQFRFSWYYIGLLSSSMSILGDLEVNSFSSIFSVVNPFSIEFPFCLSRVCNDWNKSVAGWIRVFVFRPLMAWGDSRYSKISKRRFFGLDPRHLNKIFIVLITYGISSALHGVSVRIGLVLVSLAAYTWIQHSLRKTLAKIYKISGFAPYSTGLRKSLGENHPYNRFSWASLSSFIIQSLFLILNFYHLCYLGGIMLNEATEAKEDGGMNVEEEMQVTKAIWMGCDFWSPKVVGFLLVIYLFIR